MTVSPRSSLRLRPFAPGSRRLTASAKAAASPPKRRAKADRPEHVVEEGQRQLASFLFRRFK
jgi:hypothetical protein